MAVRSVGGPHGAQLLLEVLDLVAQPGGELEVEVLGGGVHLLGELVDELDEVVLCRPGELLAHGGLGGVLASGPHRGVLMAPVATGQEVGGIDVLAGEHVGDVGDLLAQRLRVDAVLGVVGQLLGAAALSLLDGLSHGRGDGVGVHVDLAGDVAGGTSDGLHQGAGRAQEALLVRVQDGYERDLRQVQGPHAAG